MASFAFLQKTLAFRGVVTKQLRKQAHARTHALNPKSTMNQK
ncbi:hypothetical protein [Helicobacter sp.]|nr:hypothetical protein [Helicobacter sp.]